MKKSMHHIAISTPDLKRSINFYCDLMGFELEGRWDWEIGTEDADDIVGLKDSSAEYVMLKLGDFRLEVFEYKTPEPKSLTNHRACDHGIPHFCIEVEDIHAEYDRLKAAGMFFHCPVKVIAGDACTYGRDPDGNILELVQPDFEV